MGAEPIFDTQRSASWTRRDGAVLGVDDIAPRFRQKLVDRFGPMNGIDIFRMERRLADVILAGCAATQGHCFDLVADVDFDLASDFYDELHTTASGSAKIADYLHRSLTSLPDF